MKLERSGRSLGGRLDGVDIAAPISHEAFEAIERAFHESLVLCVSGQPSDEEALTRFARRFGEPEISNAKAYHHTALPHITVLSNLVVDGKPVGSSDAGRIWHTDMSYNRVAGRATLLHAHRVPVKNGVALGDTLFRNMYRAYEDLPEEVKLKIDGLEAVHSFEKVWNAQIRMGSGRLPLTEAQKAAKRPVVHPVVLRHPWTGRKALYVNRGMTERILGLTAQESDGLLDYLFSQGEREELEYRHQWRVGDTLIWDNCASIHLATGGYDSSTPRLMFRIQVLGDESRYRRENGNLGARIAA